MFDKIIAGNNDELIDALILKADTLRKLGRNEESLAIFKNLKNQPLPPLEKKQVDHSILSNYVSLKDKENGEKFLLSLKTEANHISWHIESALFYWNLGERDKAVEFLISANEDLSSTVPKEDLFELANLCFNARLFKEAANIFEIVSDINVYSPVTKKLIQSLFNSGQKGKALDICILLENQTKSC